MYEQYPILTPEQEALIPVYREKWRKVALSTEAIDRQKAAAAVTAVYTLMGKNAPKIEFCESPYAALVAISNRDEREEIQVETEVSETETPSEMVWQQIWMPISKLVNFLRCLPRSLNSENFRKTPLEEIRDRLSSAAFKSIAKKVDRDRLLPKNLSTLELVKLVAYEADRSIAQIETGSQDSNSQQSKVTEPERKQDLRGIWSGKSDKIYKSIAWIPGNRRIVLYACKSLYFSYVSCRCKEEGFDRIEKKISQYLKKEMTYIHAKYSPLFRPQVGAMQAILYDFIYSELNCPIDDRLWQAYQNLVRECGWIFTFDETCYICDRPRTLRLDEDSEPAIEFADGFRL